MHSSSDKEIVAPPFLKRGDKVAILSPSYWLPSEAIQQAAEVVESWGLVPVVGNNTDKLYEGAYAGTVDERADDLRRALEDDSIKCIICNRGGYGAIHLLERIPQSLYVSHPKWLVGYGDITTLQFSELAVGVMSIHGPMSLQFTEGGQNLSVHLLHNLLFGIVPQYEIPADSHNLPGHAEGMLMGGNLSSFVPVTGTEYSLMPDKDIILFIEEIEESLHNIDRLFFTLRLKGFLKHTKGVILGEFNGVKRDLDCESAERMLIGHLEGLHIPVCCGFPIGGNNQLSLIEGARTILDVTDEKTTLSFDIEGKRQLYQITEKKIKLTKESI